MIPKVCHDNWQIYLLSQSGLTTMEDGGFGVHLPLIDVCDCRLSLLVIAIGRAIDLDILSQCSLALVQRSCTVGHLARCGWS